VDRAVIMHPDGMAVLRKNPLSFSTVHSLIGDKHVVSFLSV
jgi:hypothetical protein